MHPHVRSLVMLTLVTGGVVACASSDTPVTTMRVTGPPTPTFDRIRATDSTLTLTNEEYSDAAPVLARTVPLRSDLVTAATIGPRGGELRIDAAGVKVVFPAGALRTTTTLTMKAMAGAVVAYDFQPHGTQFYLPVMIQQDVAATSAAAETQPRRMYGGYYGTSLDSSFVDAARTRVWVRETQLGYLDVAKKEIKIFVGHFSGYTLATRQATPQQ
jgi:hypothetical protein